MAGQWLSRRVPVETVACFAIVIASIATPAHAERPQKETGLSVLVDDPSGGASLVGPKGRVFAKNGEPLFVVGFEPDPAKPFKVRYKQGIYTVNRKSIAAVRRTMMPSATDPDTLLPVPTAADFDVADTVLLARKTVGTALLIISGSGPAILPVRRRARGRSKEPLSLLGTQSDGLANPEPLAPAGSGTGIGSGNRPVIASSDEENANAKVGGGSARSIAFVALPRSDVLTRRVAVQQADAQGQPFGRELVMPVGDVGPWSTKDAYWEGGRRPAAEGMKGQRVTYDRDHVWYPSPRGKLTCNGAGIDVSTAGWQKFVPGLSVRQAESKLGFMTWRFVN